MPIHHLPNSGQLLLHPEQQGRRGALPKRIARLSDARHRRWLRERQERQEREASTARAEPPPQERKTLEQYLEMIDIVVNEARKHLRNPT